MLRTHIQCIPRCASNPLQCSSKFSPLYNLSVPPADRSTWYAFPLQGGVCRICVIFHFTAAPLIGFAGISLIIAITTAIIRNSIAMAVSCFQFRIKSVSIKAPIYNTKSLVVLHLDHRKYYFFLLLLQSKYN